MFRLHKHCTLRVRNYNGPYNLPKEQYKGNIKHSFHGPFGMVLSVISLGVSFVLWEEIKKQKQTTQETQVIQKLEKIDLLQFKSIFKELVIKIGPCYYVDLSEVIEFEDHGQKRRKRKIDAILTSLKCKNASEENRIINSMIYYQLTLMQHAFSMLKLLNPPSYNPSFYYGKDALRRLGDYIEGSIENKDKNGVVLHEDCSLKILAKFDKGLMIWACEFFDKEKKVPQIQIIHKRLTDK